MRRHEFQPGRLVAGLVLLAGGLLYLLDATGRADAPWFLVVPLTVGGFVLAALVGMVNYAVRRDRRQGREAREPSSASRDR